jgi:hypothetical protein
VKAEWRKDTAVFPLKSGIFGQSLFVEKQIVSYWYRTTSKDSKEFHKSHATAVAMATMTFQDGGYFGFKVI